MPKTLYLHIGHSKTGSSFLQSVLAASSQNLLSKGLNYFDHRSAANAAAGNITSGNGELFRGVMETDVPAQENADSDHIFSSENLFFEFLDPDFQAKFQLLETSGRYQTIKVLLFARDPVSWCASAFQQGLKRGGTQTMSIDDQARHVAIPTQTRRVLDFLSKLPSVTVTALNYSVVSKDLLTHLCGWLNLHPSDLTEPPKRVVNRSMTASELLLLRALSDKPGNANTVLSNALCQELPEIEPDVVLPSLVAQRALWDRLSDDIAQINTYLPKEQWIDASRDIRAPKELTDKAEFNADQIRVIADCIASLNSRLLANHSHNQDQAKRIVEMRDRNKAMAATIDDLRAKLAKAPRAP